MGKKRGRPAKIKMDNSLNGKGVDPANGIIVGVDTAIDKPDTTAGTRFLEDVELATPCDDNGFDLIAREDLTSITTANLSDPISLSCSILGCDPITAMVIAGDKRRSTPNEFFYYEYGVGLSFKLDEKTGMYKVLNHRSKHTCNAACYWLIDKLIRKTDGKIFFSPGREGIVR